MGSWTVNFWLATIRRGQGVSLRAPFACPEFTVACPGTARAVRISHEPLRQVGSRRDLRSGTWCAQGDELVACFDLPKGSTDLIFDPA